MRIGFAAPVAGWWATPENMARVARRAEELGYASLWSFQRLLSPPDGSWGETYRSVTDPLTVTAFLAAHTSSIRLGIAVLNMPFVAPALLAKQAGTVDLLSGGRLDLGLGVGWSDEEFTATGADRRARGARAEEYIPLLRRFWTDDVVTHEGRFFQVPASSMDPKPVQAGGPPILLGGAAEPALRRAGALCDGWVSSSRADPSTLGDSVRIVRAAAEDAGRDPMALRMVCRGAVRIRPSAEDGLLAGPLEKVREDLAVLEAQGITEFFVDLNFDPEIGSPDADPSKSMDRAEEALEAFRPSAGA